jgi:hypothetical protein
MAGTGILSKPVRRLNPQYGATLYAVIDIASRKNAISGYPS